MSQKLSQARLDVSEKGQLTYHRWMTPFPHYPQIEPRLRWPRFYSDAKVQGLSNASSYIHRLSDELLLQIFQDSTELDRAYVKERCWFADHGLRDGNNNGSDEDHSVVDVGTRDGVTADIVQYIRDYGVEGIPLSDGCRALASAYALTLTCRRFHGPAVQILYEDIDFEDEWRWYDRAHQKTLFNQTMARTPMLRQFLKRLALRDVTLSSDEIRLLMSDSSLKFLSLQEIRGNNEDPRIGPLPHEQRTSQLTELHMRGFRGGPSALQSFLRWPKDLNTFTLGHIISDGWSSWEQCERSYSPGRVHRWSHALLTNVLASQRQHLQTLKLGWMGYTRDQNSFNVALFPRLNTLQLCISYERPNEVAVEKWFSPSLQTLILDFHTNSSQGGPWTNFRDRHVNWIEELLQGMVKRRNPAMGLREVGLLVHSEGDNAFCDEDEWSCGHGQYTDKTVILKALKTIEQHGYSGFWVGHSGSRHTVQTIEDACTCKSRNK